MSYFLEGNSLYINKNYEKALSFYKKAIEHKENEPHALYNSAVCYIKLKEYDKAIKMIENTLLLNLDSKYFFNLAYCYSMKDDNKKALRYFNIAWAMNNEDKDCKKAIDLIIKNLL
ncbi:tetratricopeptide repeat protein [Clostridium fallax]|uniref:Tetratricopeptide repeat-containing protein n=1 Tax=Clostridium fallax TaxID=1533 RepID=A0A1M4WM30_9CLOT|nr:tetratricopeptide repeat protein [Clostridium fallax]SHE82296.1 Tetratricopeptide repeat-containing protein [Clostridium fallax]SQB06226.1 TPR domain-containing protein [Clostridium fallax]